MKKMPKPQELWISKEVEKKKQTINHSISTNLQVAQSENSVLNKTLFHSSDKEH